MEIGKPATHEETVSALDAAAKTREGGDAFRLRIQRRMGPTQPPQIYALFEDAQVAHFATPETWLPRLVGAGAGGIFELAAYHMSNAIMSIGAPIRIPIDGEQRPPNLDVVKDPSWPGPRGLAYPRPGDSPSPVAFSVGGTGAPSQRRDSLSSDAPVPPIPSHIASSIQQPDQGRLLAAEEALRNQQRSLEQQQQQYREQTLRAEILASTKAQTDAVMEALRRSQEQTAEILRSIAQQPKAPAFDFAGVLTSVAPLVLGFLKSSQDTAQEAAKRQEAILMALLTKPSSDTGVVDRLVKMTEQMIDQQRNQPNASAAMVSQMSEAMAGMAGVTMQLVHTAAEMSSGGPAPEPGWVKAVREGAKVITAMMQTQAQVALATANGMRTLPPTVAPGPMSAPGPSAIDKIATAITKKAPVDKVTLAILNNLKDPSIVAAFAEAGGDPEVVFRNKLGSWLNDPANQSYMTTLMAEIEKVGKARGVMPSDDAKAEGEEEGEEEAEGEEEEPDEEESDVDAPTVPGAAPPA